LQLFIKCENFQRTGSFKFRGAFNALSRLSEEQRQNGVVAFSTGNHGQAVALSARLLGTKAVIVMPHDTPAVKVAATKGYGAEVYFYDRMRDDREKIAAEFMNAQGMVLIPPFDHSDVIAGQASAAAELFEQAGELDYLLVPLGGGGLLAGTALARDLLSPGCQLYGVEPEAANDGQQSLRSGTLCSIAPPTTIADGAQTVRLGVRPFEIIRQRVVDVVTVSDAQLIDSMRVLAERLKIVVEPTGCLAFAGARFSELPLSGKRVGVILSGGNVDLAQFARLIAR
jgi:threonine dehydratase